MFRRDLLLLVTIAQLSWACEAVTTYEISARYEPNTKCSGTPYNLYIHSPQNCTPDDTCGTDSIPRLASTAIICTTDYRSSVQGLFGGAPYIIMESYIVQICNVYGNAFAYLASGECEGNPNSSDFAVAELRRDGSGLLQTFSSATCSGESIKKSYEIDKNTLSTHVCNGDGAKWYSSNDYNSSTSSHSGLGTATIVGTGGGVIGFILVIALAVCCFKRHLQAKHKRNPLQTTTTLGSAQAAVNVDSIPHTETTGLWNDETIVAKRIPREKVSITRLLSQGAYGEVYSGIFNGQQVAVKMLLPSTRNNLQHVNEFLAEAKMTAIMDHPHIVSFIGVAWDSLSDVCVVLEFMDGGDLRTLLDKFEKESHPVGLNRQKITIALQVCHALVYLHSLRPPVIHRDLKSRNVLLNEAKEAKLSDFGISRERMERTMTAGVGTSLWMAPEVMLGEWYDDKADMFSFGVLLSELDVHTLPYATAKQRNRDHFGRQMPEAVLLQQIASGNVRVDFSEATSASISSLGYACVSIDPRLRPSAAEVLYKLQLVLSQEMCEQHSHVMC